MLNENVIFEVDENSVGLIDPQAYGDGYVIIPWDNLDELIERLIEIRDSHNAQN